MCRNYNPGIILFNVLIRFKLYFWVNKNELTCKQDVLILTNDMVFESSGNVAVWKVKLLSFGIHNVRNIF